MAVESSKLEFLAISTGEAPAEWQREIRIAMDSTQAGRSWSKVWTFSGQVSDKGRRNRVMEGQGGEDKRGFSFFVWRSNYACWLIGKIRC